MSPGIASRLPELLEALRSQDRSARDKLRGLTEQPIPTMYFWAADELETRGAPSDAWPVTGGLLSVLTGTLALPDSARFGDVITEVLRLIAGKGEQTGLATALLCEYAMPGDVWAADLILEALKAAASPRAANGAVPTLSADTAIAALPLIRDAQAVEPLLLLASKRHKLAPAAALALARMGERRVVPPLLALLDRGPSLEAVEGLGLLRALQAVGPLIERLAPPFLDRIRRSRGETGDWWVLTITRALGDIGDPAAIEPVAALLKDRQSPDALCAAVALTRLGDPRGLALIEERHPHWGGRQAPEPGSPEWDAAGELAARGDDRGFASLQTWYQFDPRIKPGQWKRAAGDRRRWLQTLGLQGRSRDLPLVLWAEANDFDQTEQGWPLATEASRTRRRIEAREALLAGN